MKFSILIFLITLSNQLLAQDSIPGRYRDYFGSRLYLNADSTFKYTWNFHMVSSWTKGRWEIINDTIYLKMIPTWDTVTMAEPRNAKSDSLILSTDEMPERITVNQEPGMFFAGGQNRFQYPQKLLLKKGRLYKIENGRLIHKKQKGFSTKKKWDPWYFKSND